MEAESDKFLIKINKILKRQLTERSYELWIGLSNLISNKCWNKPTSSTLKHHKKEDEGNRVPSISEHTYEMLYATEKVISMFDGMLNKDVIFLSIALHDSFKYGLAKNSPHTENRHDHLIGEIVKNNKKIFLQVLNEDDFNILEEAVRFHSGRFSTDANINFNFRDHSIEVFFLNFLDMMSSKNLIKVLEDKN